MKPHVCPKCDGECEVMDSGIDGSAATIATKPCPPCKGTGIIWEMEPVYVPSVWVDPQPDSETVITYSKPQGGSTEEGP